MLTCKQACSLASEAIDRKLSFRERFSLRLHIMLCKMCHRYVQQINRLHNILRRKNEISPESHLPGLSTDARERIRSKL